jgi:hypothetical protein
MVAARAHHQRNRYPIIGYRKAEAIVAFEAARAINQELAEANHAVSRFQRDLARCHASSPTIGKLDGSPFLSPLLRPDLFVHIPLAV